MRVCLNLWVPGIPVVQDFHLLQVDQPFQDFPDLPVYLKEKRGTLSLFVENQLKLVSVFYKIVALFINCLTSLQVKKKKKLDVKYLESLVSHPDLGNLLIPGYQPNQHLRFFQVFQSHLLYQVHHVQVVQFHLVAPSAQAALKTTYVTVNIIMGI